MKRKGIDMSNENNKDPHTGETPSIQAALRDLVVKFPVLAAVFGRRVAGANKVDDVLPKNPEQRKGSLHPEQRRMIEASRLLTFHDGAITTAPDEKVYERILDILHSGNQVRIDHLTHCGVDVAPIEGSKDDDYLLIILSSAPEEEVGYEAIGYRINASHVSHADDPYEYCGRETVEKLTQKIHNAPKDWANQASRALLQRGVFDRFLKSPISLQAVEVLGQKVEGAGDAGATFETSVVGAQFILDTNRILMASNKAIGVALGKLHSDSEILKKVGKTGVYLVDGILIVDQRHLNLDPIAYIINPDDIRGIDESAPPFGLATLTYLTEAGLLRKEILGQIKPKE
jgi:hypothetical protein